MATLASGISVDHRGEYVIRSGDTLWEIAKRVYGDPTRWREIAEASGIANPNRIRVGMVLKIPGMEAAPPLPRAKPERKEAAVPLPKAKPDRTTKKIEQAVIEHAVTNPKVKAEDAEAEEAFLRRQAAIRQTGAELRANDPARPGTEASPEARPSRRPGARATMPEGVGTLAHSPEAAPSQRPPTFDQRFGRHPTRMIEEPNMVLKSQLKDAARRKAATMPTMEGSGISEATGRGGTIANPNPPVRASDPISELFRLFLRR